MKRRRHTVWAPMPPRPVLPSEAERREIIHACDALIRDVLKPRFLPAITPTTFNYLVGLDSAYAGGRYRFLKRYRSGFEDNEGQEFDAPFARIDRWGRAASTCSGCATRASGGRSTTT